MPSVILSEATAAESEVELIHPTTGELTAEAQVISDFLTHLDLSPVSEVEGVDELAIDGECDNEEGVAEKCSFLPGEAVAELVDEADLNTMFRHYLNAEAKRITEDPKATLESKARLAPFVDLLDEVYKKGAFAKMHRQPAGHNRAARQMTAMLKKGVIKHVKKGTGQGKGKDYAKGKGYATGGTPAGKKLVMMFKGKNTGKIKKAAMKAKQKVKESEGFDAEATPIFGLGVPVESVAYVATLRENAVEQLGEAKKRMKGMKMKGAGTPPMPKPPMSAENANGDQSSRTVAEGARLAGSILNLNEARSGTTAAAMKS